MWNHGCMCNSTAQHSRSKETTLSSLRNGPVAMPKPKGGLGGRPAEKGERGEETRDLSS